MCMYLNVAPGLITPTCSGSSGTPGAFALANPDFNTRSLRGDAVLRWEYRPGSTLYLVWQQVRSNNTLYGDVATFSPNRDGGLLSRAPGQNIVSLKMTYWLGR